ncbi:GPR1/FUN34/yaaH family-domain-containing protein [Mycena crocata]|nr:GPR1/FUN34/yaaH family-domain-containing protein [Mycena crocata]
MTSVNPDTHFDPDPEKGPADNEPSRTFSHTRIHLTEAQYDRLFFQPGRGEVSAPKQFGNPTAFAIISYLMAFTPTSVFLMCLDGTSTTSLPAITGVFYFIGGLGLTIGGVMEWVLGNTFPFVVFTTFGGCWLSLGVLFDPSKGILSAYTDATLASFNHGLQFYFTFWAILCGVYVIASLRTNVVFVIALGNPSMALTFLKIGGAFAFANVVAGWYLALVLMVAAAELPLDLPVGDLSRFLQRKRKE